MEKQQINCRVLTEQINNLRWLSIPHSRLTINPSGGYDFLPMKSPVAEEFGAGLPINAAYWIGSEPEKLPMLWSIQPLSVDNQPSVNIIDKSINLFDDKLTDKTSSNTTTNYVSDCEQIILTDQSFGYRGFTRNIDIDSTPFVIISIEMNKNSRWALKVNDGSYKADLYIKGDSDESGDFIFDLRTLGWKGIKTFTLKLFIIGDPGDNFVCSSLKYASTNKNLNVYKTNKIFWSPDKITTLAESTNNKSNIKSTIFFSDTNTIAQQILTENNENDSLLIRGYFPTGKIIWDDINKILILKSSRFQTIISINKPVVWMGVSKSTVDSLAGKYDKYRENGVWALRLEKFNKNDELNIIAFFASAESDTTKLIRQAKNKSSAISIKQSLANREKSWDNFISKIPIPSDFNLYLVDNKGIKPETIKQTYYRAWVFLLSNILPSMPENEYPYPQVTCGKPSLWAEGHPKSSASAQWESMIAMMFTACIDPDTTWKSYEGMMSLVDDKGTLGGEGLPSRHAQVAWILYNETGELERLRKCYPDMKRLLQWKIDDPRWIYKGLTESGTKDIEFVYSAIIDISYMSKITEKLGMPDETQYWKSQSNQLAVNFKNWFWDGSSNSVYRIYNQISNTRYSPDNAWSLPSIILSPEILKQPELDNLLTFFKSSLNNKTPFMIWNLTKYPSLGFVMRGAIQYGLIRETEMLAETIMRDIAATTEFAETYDQSVYPPRPTGVTPSVFGAANIIDSVLIHNGLLYTDGIPILLKLNNSGSVQNISVADKIINISDNKNNYSKYLSGNGISILKKPDTAAGIRDNTLPKTWEINMNYGESIPLSHIN